MLKQAWPIVFILAFLYADCISWICHLFTFKLSALYMYRLYNKNEEFMENLNWIAIQIVHITTLIILISFPDINFKQWMQFSDPVYILRTPWCAKLNLNIQWLAIPQYLRIISLIFILTGIIEFICSQVPYSMKGIMMGALYTLVTICSVPIVGVFVVLLEKDLSILGERTISCAFWYTLLMIAAYLSFPNFSLYDKAIQDAEKRRVWLASQRALHYRKILPSINEQHLYYYCYYYK